MADADVARAMKIKTNTLRRLHKELDYYTSEQQKERARVEDMKAAGSDPHDLRQAESVLAESSMMIPETRQRLEAAMSDLHAYMEENEAPQLEADILQAQEVIAQAKQAFCC